MDNRIILKKVKKCNFYNVGYCRYKEKCHFKHPKSECLNSACERRNCDKRHPRACKFQNLGRKCKHGENCAFKHIKSVENSTSEAVTKSALLKVKDELIKKKDEEIKGLKRQNKSDRMEKDKEIDELKAKLLKNQNDIKRKDAEIVELENKVKNASKEALSNFTFNSNKKIQCEKCEFQSKSKSGLNKHMKSKHKDMECSCELCDFTSERSEHLTEHLKTHEYDKYNNMNDDEQYEVKEMICGQVCWQGYHKCYELKEENELLGVDVDQIKEDYKNCVEKEVYYCESCKYKSGKMESVKDHFMVTHTEWKKLS